MDAPVKPAGASQIASSETSARRSRPDSEWWRGATIYQIYPRSFADSNGDGDGDLRGILDRLDYIAELGVDAVWLSPFFKSPMKDMGYDVSDYRAVDPMFGTLEDFRALVSACHERNLKVIIDQVYSHTSNEHPWFIESASSRDNPKADWYVWADPKPDGSPPNNWLARFGGIAWEWSSARRQYYLHNFLTEQPDLNVHNPEVQAEIIDTMRFWFDMGVDGLRLDVVNFFMHDRQLRDNPPRLHNDLPNNPNWMQQHLYNISRPQNLPFLAKMRAAADGAADRMLLGEIACDRQIERMAEYTSAGRLHTAYSFELLGARLDGAHIARSVQEAGAADAWPCWAFSNHDVIRVATRWAAEGNLARIELFQALLLSLRGTVILYQGEELGLAHADVPRHRLQDPEAIRLWPNHRRRDGARTPIPWQTDGLSLGFSEADGWLPADPIHAAFAVATQEKQENSALAKCRRLVALRQSSQALRLGSFEVLQSDPTTLVFVRRHNAEALLCGFNFGTAKKPLDARGEILAGALEDGHLAPDGYVILRPH